MQLQVLIGPGGWFIDFPLITLPFTHCVTAQVIMSWTINHSVYNIPVCFKEEIFYVNKPRGLQLQLRST